MEHGLKISNHHGDLNKPNNLKATREIITQYGHEIDIYEIDFVSSHGRIISSHDYEGEKIRSGSTLEKWIREVVINNRKILWADIKENLPIFFSCGYGKFDTDALFNSLNDARKWVLENKDFDIQPYIWLGCQEPELHEEICHRKGDWTVILDMPRVNNYILQYIPFIPKSYLRDKICQESKESSYRDYSIITIDQSFFFTRKEIKDFIKSLKLAKDTKVVINSFEKSVRPIDVDGLEIIMQYNYRV